MTEIQLLGNVEFVIVTLDFLYLPIGPVIFIDDEGYEIAGGKDIVTDGKIKRIIKVIAHGQPEE